MAKTLKDALSKSRRVLLDLSGRPRLEGLILSVEDEKLRLYQHKTARHGADVANVPLATINSVWDRSSGSCVWRKPQITT